VDAGHDWTTLYRNAVPRVYRALLATLRDPGLAEDALHEAFAEGLRRPPASAENLPGWLFRVALRRARRRRWSFASLHGQEQRAATDDLMQPSIDSKRVGCSRSLQNANAPLWSRTTTSASRRQRPRTSLACDPAR